MHRSARSELAPNGVLRAGIAMGNFLLVTGRSAADDPEGVAPGMARAIAGRLGVEAVDMPFASPGSRVVRKNDRGSLNTPVAR